MYNQPFTEIGPQGLITLIYPFCSYRISLVTVSMAYSAAVLKMTFLNTSQVN